MITRQWNSDDLVRDFPQANNLGEIIAQLHKTLDSNGEVLCEVRVNDLLLSEDEEDKFSTTPLGDIRNLNVKASTPEGLLQESLDGCKEYLERLSRAFEKTADLYRLEDLSKAHEFYHSCIRGADWFVQLLTHYKVVHQSVEGHLPLEWLSAEARLMQTLNQVLAAYEKKDFILLADLLEYELTTVLEIWRALLATLENGHIHSTETKSSIC